jgi:hypothetical protein
MESLEIIMTEKQSHLSLDEMLCLGRLAEDWHNGRDNYQTGYFEEFVVHIKQTTIHKEDQPKRYDFFIEYRDKGIGIYKDVEDPRIGELLEKAEDWYKQPAYSDWDEQKVEGIRRARRILRGINCNH